ncbi:MAG: hypothetical protein IIW47_01890, partial [Bacteroidales bacterium]|nr:hypothetical protein [Bacteroidales bacterium]
MSLSEFFNASKIRYHREKANEALADFNREDAEYHFGKAISLGSKDVFRDILIEHAKGNMNDDYICLVYDYIGDDKPKWFQEYEREAKTLKLKISKEQYLDSSKSIWSKSDASILYNEGNIMFLKGDYKNAEYYFVEAFKNGLAEAYGKILENSSNFSENLLDILCSWNVDLNINGDTDYITGKAFLDLYYRAVQNSSDNWTEDDTKNCLNTALEHFNSAASKGYKDAESKILEIKNLRWSSQRNIALSYFQNGQLQESVSLLTKLAKDGDSESYYILGTMLFKRVEVNKNSECVDSYMAQCVEYFL